MFGPPSGLGPNRVHRLVPHHLVQPGREDEPLGIRVAPHFHRQFRRPLHELHERFLDDVLMRSVGPDERARVAQER